jgi:3'-phosphoadenosine 5'-phosphosulfate sulfotransferase (PAPS reductase)/FAD synthetase
MDYILSLSYGKDSLACLGAIEELGWPLTRIIHAEVWTTDTIPADLPPMVEFKKHADGIIKERWGIEVEHITSGKTYEQCFYSKYTRGKKIGQIYGFPMANGSWCNSRLKVGALMKIDRNAVMYIGIAADEPSRFHNLTETKRSPLVEAGWDEDKCRKWCIDNDLLSPIYTTATRGGCWFCHKQPIDQLRMLRKQYPDYWAMLLKWDADSICTFKASGKTVHDFDERFRIEDEGFISPDEKFRWEMLDSGGVNYRLF